MSIGEPVCNDEIHEAQQDAVVKQSIHQVKTGAPAVVLDVSALPDEFASVQILNLDQLLATIDRAHGSAILEGLRRGVYGLIAVATRKDGTKVCSPPKAMAVA